MEKIDLKEQMDLAKAERKMLHEDQGSSSSLPAVRVPEQVKRNHPSNAEINKMLDECYTFLGAGKVDGTKACRVYCPSTTKQKATRETQEKTQEKSQCMKIPANNKKNTQSVPRETIGYFPSPTCKSPDRNPDKALEALYRQQAVMGSFTGPEDRTFRVSWRSNVVSLIYTKLRRECRDVV